MFRPDFLHGLDLSVSHLQNRFEIQNGTKHGLSAADASAASQEFQRFNNE